MLSKRRLQIALTAGVLVFGLFVVSTRRDIPHSETAECLHHAKTIALACKLYASDHGGKYPARLDELIPGYLPDGSMFSCPFSPGSREIGYEYFGGRDTDPAHQMLLRSQKTDGQHRRILIYADASGAVVRDR